MSQPGTAPQTFNDEDIQRAGANLLRDDDFLRGTMWGVDPSRRERWALAIIPAILATIDPIIERRARAVAAKALRDAADDPTGRLGGHSGVSVRWLRKRADQIERGEA